MPAHVMVAAVASADAGSFVVLGASRSAWARKFSRDGQTLWEYSSGEAGSSASDTYLDAAPMPDGSTFLCGRWMRPPGSPEPSALLTHVDARGKRLSETLISPTAQPGSSPRLAYFQSCVRSGSHVLLHGYLLRKADWTAPGTASQMHWFVDVDEKSNVSWQREIPETDFHSHFSEGDVLLSIGNEFFVSRTDNRQTEVLRLSASGDALGRLVLSGPFHLVRPLQGDAQVELVGLMAGKGQLIRLKGNLSEDSRTPVSLPDLLSTTQAFKLPDGSLCLFGTTTHSWGQGVRAAIAHADAGLRAARIAEPTWRGSQNAIVNLPAAPIDSEGVFVTAVRLVLKTGASAQTNAFTKSDTSESLALDFWQTR